MLSVEDWAEIRRLHRAEGLPIKVIARVLGISKNREVRQTIVRVIAAHLQETANIPSSIHNFDFTDVLFENASFEGSHYGCWSRPGGCMWHSVGPVSALPTWTRSVRRGLPGWCATVPGATTVQRAHGVTRHPRGRGEGQTAGGQPSCSCDKG